MKTISSSDAAALLEDGWTVSTSGFTGSGHPEGITTAIEMREGRLTLAEIAPGVDLERQVLAQLAAPVAVAPELKTMDARIFRDAPMLAART
jgi:acyl CoA:acetate/3-ketoacid CoA transferase